MKPVARFVVRDAGDKKEGLGLLAVCEQGHFTPGDVYEIREVLGTKVIVNIGRSVVRKSFADKSNVGFVWVWEIGYLLKAARHYIWTTTEEWEQEQEEDSND